MFLLGQVNPLSLKKEDLKINNSSYFPHKNIIAKILDIRRELLPVKATWDTKHCPCLITKNLIIQHLCVFFKLNDVILLCTLPLTPPPPPPVCVRGKTECASVLSAVTTTHTGNKIHPVVTHHRLLPARRIDTVSPASHFPPLSIDLNTSQPCSLIHIKAAVLVPLLWHQALKSGEKT